METRTKMSKFKSKTETLTKVQNHILQKAFEGLGLAVLGIFLCA